MAYAFRIRLQNNTPSDDSLPTDGTGVYAMTEERTLTKSAELVREFERLQAEFEAKNPELAEAMKVMNMSLTEYLAALHYMREGGQLGGSSDHAIPLTNGQSSYAAA